MVHFIWTRTCWVAVMKTQAESGKPASREAQTNPQTLTLPSLQEVSERAYFYYLNAGGPHGHDLDHWLHAEQDLTLGQARTRFHGLHN